ncbi:MAG: recombinase family protein [Planctomycetes bacterium]|nr:recombinase family protein [Planctomycetota bacterium]
MNTPITTTSKLRAATFARVSSEDQAAEGKASLPAQRDATRRYVETVLGGEVVAEFVEEGVSGALEYRQRPEIARLLSLAETGKLDAVVWAYADRQGRSVIEVTLVEQELRKWGVDVYLVEGGKRDRNTADGVLVEGVRDLVAEAERLRIKARMATGRYANARAGQWTTGIPPTGYAVGADKKLVIDETEAEYIRYAFACVVAGDDIEGAARKLNARWPDYSGKRGGYGFFSSTVGRWLRNQLYVGEGTDISVSPSPGSPREPFNIPAPALVDRQTFEAVRQNLIRTVAAWRRSNKVTEAKKARNYALSGGRLVHVHGSGGEAMFFGMTRDGIRRYRCSHSVTRYHERWGPNEVRAARDGFDRCCRRTCRWPLGTCPDAP